MDYYAAPGRNHLFVPGPSNIPDKVMQAMNRGNEDHRSLAFPKFSKQLLDDVRKIFFTTTGTPFIIPTTGTGSWESCATNTLSPGDKVLTFVFGHFSHLWAEQLRNLHYDVDVVNSEWGRGVDLEALHSKLKQDRNHDIKAVCIVHNETSTGVNNNLGVVRRILGGGISILGSSLDVLLLTARLVYNYCFLDENKHPALLLVDGVSSIGALEFRMDEWGVDVAVTGSQKSLGLPTGLGIICASPKAIQASKRAKSPRSFFSWDAYLRAYQAGSYWPYTPSTHLLSGLRAALDLLFEEGLENVNRRHHRLAHATRLAVKAWGLELSAQDPELYSDTVTAILVPSHINSTDIVRAAWRKYNLSLGIGLNELSEKAFRIGHLGFVNELQLLAALAGVEMTLRDVGLDMRASGVSAALEFLRKETPLIASRSKL